MTPSLPPRRCDPAIKGLVRNKTTDEGELIFFGIENKLGFHGDKSIPALVAAIEGDPSIHAHT